MASSWPTAWYHQRRGADLLAGVLDPGRLGGRGAGSVAAAEHLLAVPRARQARPGPGAGCWCRAGGGPTGADGAPGVFCCGLRVVTLWTGPRRTCRTAARTSRSCGRPFDQCPGRARSRRSGGWWRPSRGPGALLGASEGADRDRGADRWPWSTCMPRPGDAGARGPEVLSWSLARAFARPGRASWWRASAAFALRPVKVLRDGTYLAELDSRPKTRRSPRSPCGSSSTPCIHSARRPQGRSSSEVFCLVTDLLDTEEYPALDLACCYPDRWGCETVIGHHKTDMGQGQPVLRSGDPEGVLQEHVGPVRRASQAIGQLRRRRRSRHGHPAPEQPSASRTPCKPRPPRSRLSPPDELDLALAAFLMKILTPGFFVRDRRTAPAPGRPRSGRRLPRPKTRRAQRHQRHPTKSSST